MNPLAEHSETLKASSAGGTPSLHVVVSCTNTKRLPPTPGLRVRDLPRSPVERRVAEWIQRLAKLPVTRIPAERLYAGDHWSIARTLPEVASSHGYRTTLWVLSAGYGLIPADRSVAPYSATFSPGSPDSIGTKAEGSVWWSALATWRMDSTEPRSLTELALRNPSSHIMVAAAPTYLHPLWRDICDAGAVLNNDDQLVVLSAGARNQSGELNSFLVPIDSRLLHTVGGSRVTLNIRAARFILERADETHLNRRAVSHLLGEHLESLPVAPMYSRVPMTDDEVRNYIRDRLSEDPTTSATRMLRELRRQGRACEQKRFHQLVREVRKIYG